MTNEEIKPNEYNVYYHSYIKKAGTKSLKEGFKNNGDAIITFLETIPEDKLEFRYAEGKWTIKEIIQHLMDTERIFTYRALCFSRQEQTALPGYDQDAYAKFSDANNRSKISLINEYKAVRLATILLFDSFNDDMLLRIGNASNSDLSVRAIGFIIIGHENHHIEVIKNRYL